jgi:hypothetical protein
MSLASCLLTALCTPIPYPALPDGWCGRLVSHSCQIESLPTPEYPRVTEAREADCVVRFQIQYDGSVRTLSVSCTDPRFEETTATGMKSVRYGTRDSCGLPCPNIGRVVDYPIEYRFASD